MHLLGRVANGGVFFFAVCALCQERGNVSEGLKAQLSADAGHSASDWGKCAVEEIPDSSCRKFETVELRESAIKRDGSYAIL